MKRSLQEATDTIAALATPVGNGAIAIIRISGSQALSSIRHLKQDATFAPPANHLTLVTLYDPQTHLPLDESMVVYFKAPKSYTGEDMVEIHCHGGMVLVQYIKQALSYLGVRMANRGEFTLRAFHHRKMDLTQVESILDLIQAPSAKSLMYAYQHLKQELYRYIMELKLQWKEMLSLLEVAIDFPDDEEEAVDYSTLEKRLLDHLSDLERFVDHQKQSSWVRDGFRLVLIGKPNAGKSSLFNRLIRQQRSIVTDLPGTTRDFIESTLLLQEVPFTLIDTAGYLINAHHEVDQQSMERTVTSLKSSDGIFWVMDQSQPFTDEDESVQSLIQPYISTKPVYILLNKSDLSADLVLPPALSGLSSLSVSALRNEGIDACYRIMESMLPSLDERFEDQKILCNERQIRLIQHIHATLIRCLDNVRDHASVDMIAQDIWECIRFAEEITGETTPEDVLNDIFTRFCIGK